MIRIGVTGHRILTNQEKIKAGINQVIDRLILSYPETEWEIISALAEGADCLFVEEAMKKLLARLVVVLPLPKDKYLHEFHDSSNKVTFNLLLNKAEKVTEIIRQVSKEKSYLAAGIEIVDNCDILVAIWDGRKAQGIGGTEEIVQLARQKGLPLAWIKAGNRRPGTLEPTSLKEKQGFVTFERLPLV